VRAYLAEFLSDPRVVGLPRLVWLPILHGVVLRSRPAKVAPKYAEIWLPEGSPLAVYTERQARLLAARLKVPVRHAMRYGKPSIPSALADLDDPLVIPLYPQYAGSTTESIVDCLPKRTRFVRDFHDDPGYVAAVAANVRRFWNAHGRGETLLMSFHGLPKRGAEGYEAQCRRSGALIAEALGLSASQHRVTFQSRFGYARWLEPYSQPTLVELATQGRKRVDVVCPGFVADCLETLEEIGITARRAFMAAGVERLGLVPCLNDAPEWIAALAAISGR